MEAILFDWDGTLADTLGVIYRANVEVMAALGLPFDQALYRRHFAPDWRVMYERLGVPLDRLDEANTRWWAALDAADTVLFPGVPEALERLAAAGHPLGIVTAGRSDRVGAELRQHGIDRLFGVVVYGDDGPVQKPDPAPLRAALAALGRADDAASSVYVGDTPDDMRMAVAAGVGAVGIESVLGDAADLRAAGATETAATAVEWVGRRFGRPSFRQPISDRPVDGPAAG
jgi:HAD superfamily hydrolase (TIGR01549 family)